MEAEYVQVFSKKRRKRRAQTNNINSMQIVLKFLKRYFLKL